ICVLTRTEVERLFYEHPAFGFFLTRLITKRLLENQRSTEAQLADARRAVVRPPIRPLAPALLRTPEHAARR
ncbi:MAG: hypothetical protein AAFN05_14770, partial [Pseudomonadota bacterium]